MWIKTPDGKLANTNCFHEIEVQAAYNDKFWVVGHETPTSSEDYAVFVVLFRSESADECRQYLENIGDLLSAVDTAGYEIGQTCDQENAAKINEYEVERAASRRRHPVLAPTEAQS